MTVGRRTKRGPAARNFYRAALAAAEQGELRDAAAAEGLDDEVALLRMLVRRELAARPEDIRPLLQGLTLLVRAVAARHRIAPADQEALEQRMAGALAALTASLSAEEPPEGGSV